ncbi:MAG: amidohydrolase family protein [bacterium]|nr:amidohydrolase family protein [bacterium]
MGFPDDIGIIDCGVGFPYTDVEKKKAAYEFMRPLYKDKETLDQMEFPAEYMFKNVPDIVPPDTDVVEWTLAEMDNWGVQVGMCSLSDNGIEAKKRHPDRFVLTMEATNTNDVMGTVRQIKEAKAEHDIVAVGCFPCGQFPQVPICDPKMYPLYATCVELDLPLFMNAGIVGPRMPSYPQHVEHLDRVCYDFPELTLVTRHGCEPWEKLAMKLMLKWPGLHYCTSAFAPKHYPEEIVKYANTRGADKILYCGYFPAGISLERQFTEMREFNPFKDPVWPKFLRDNALRVLKLDEKLGLEKASE